MSANHSETKLSSDIQPIETEIDNDQDPLHITNSFLNKNDSFKEEFNHSSNLHKNDENLNSTVHFDSNFNKNEYNNNKNNIISRFFNTFFIGTGGLPLFTCVIIGVILGYICIELNISKINKRWISLPGDIFIRILRCLVIPTIFSSLTIGIADIVSIHKASSVGIRMILLYILTTVLAATQGMIWSKFFLKDIFPSKSFIQLNTLNNDQMTISFKCNNDLYVSSNDSIIGCSHTKSNTTLSNFIIKDINNYFVHNQISITSSKFNNTSDEVLDIIKTLIPSNIIQSFDTSSLLGIITFSILFGIALGKIKIIESDHHQTISYNLILDVMRQINYTLSCLIHKLIQIAPIALISLISGAIVSSRMTTNNKFEIFKQISYLMITFITANLSHLFIILPFIYFIICFTSSNPYKFIYKLFPAHLFAIGLASSLATLPVTLRCMDSSNGISRTLSRFIIPIGLSLNMNGTAIYFPLAIFFLVSSSGLYNETSMIQWIIVVIASSITSFGGAPVPSAGLVKVLSIWQSLFSDTIPITFSYLVAIDWLMDRFRTITNITANAMIARMIAEQVDEKIKEEEVKV